MRDIDFRWLVRDGERTLQFRYMQWHPGDIWDWTSWKSVKEVHQ